MRKCLITVALLLVGASTASAAALAPLKASLTMKLHEPTKVTAVITSSATHRALTGSWLIACSGRHTAGRYITHSGDRHSLRLPKYASRGNCVLHFTASMAGYGSIRAAALETGR